MATSPFANPLLEAMNVSDTLEPFAPYAPPPVSGVGLTNLAPAPLVNQRMLQEPFTRANQFDMPEMRRPPAAAAEVPSWARQSSNVFYNPATKEFSVGGFKFAEADEASALEALKYADRPAGSPGSDWLPIDSLQYGQFAEAIRNPTLGRLFTRNFGRGVDTTQMLFGRGLQLLGAEQLGGDIVRQQMEDLRRTSPYERMFTDVGNAPERGLSDWLVANFAQAGPSIVESIVTGALGFLGGTAASGNPLGGAAASLAAVIGKESWKNSVKAALYKAASGKSLTAAEQSLVKQAAGVGGAVAAQFASGVATGAADIYGEFREQGAGSEDVGARLVALAGSVPYALLDTLPDALLIGRLMGRGGRPELSSLATTRAKAGEVAKRAGLGVTAGGLAEGFAEGGQEALLLGITGQDLTSPANIERLINSFAAGAAVGGPIGLATNVFNPTNLIEPGAATQPTGSTQKITPTQPTLPANAPVGTQGTLFPQPPAAGLTNYARAAEGSVTPVERSQQELLQERRQLEGVRDNIVEQLMSTVVTNERRDQLGRQLAQVRTALATVNQQLDTFGGAPAFAAGAAPGQLSLFGPETTDRTVAKQNVAQNLAAAQAGLIQPEMGLQAFIDQRIASASGRDRAPIRESVEVGTPTLPAFLPGEQGVLNIFQPGEMVSAAEIEQRLQGIVGPSAPVQQPVVQRAEPNPLQLELGLPVIPPGQPELFTASEAPRPKRGELLRRKREQEAAQADVAARQAGAPTPPTLLTAELLERVGLPRNSKYHKALVGKDMADPAQQPEIAQIFAEVRTSKTVKKSVKQAIETLAMQAFQSLGRQAEMFGPQGEVTEPAAAPVTEQPKPRGKRALQKRSAETVPAQNEPEVGGGVGQEVSKPQKPAGKSRIAKGKKAEAVEGQDVPTAVEEVEATTGKKPQEEGPAAVDLTDEQKQKAADRALTTIGGGATTEDVSRDTDKQKASDILRTKDSDVRKGIQLSSVMPTARWVIANGLSAETVELIARKARQAFGKLLKSTWSYGTYPTKLESYRRPELGRAAVSGDIQKALGILSKSKNNVIAWVGELGKGLPDISVVVDPDAAERTTRALDEERQFLKIELARLDHYRAIAAKIDAEPDRRTLLGLVPSLYVVLNGERTYIPEPDNFRETREGIKKLLAEYEAKFAGREDILRRMVDMYENPIAVGGSYNPLTKTISVASERDAASEHIFAHEVVHALTYEAITNPSPEQRDTVTRLRALYDAVKNDPLIKGRYGAVSMEEFISEGLSDAEFQFRLANIPYKGQTAWGKFTQFIANLLGLKNDNAFMELIALSEELLTPAAKGTSSVAPAPKPKDKLKRKPRTAEELLPSNVPSVDTLYRADTIRRKYPGFFWSSLPEVAAIYAKKSTTRQRKVETTQDIPKKTLNVTELAKLSEKDRQVILRDMTQWAEQNGVDDVQDMYMHDVLVGGETDFVYPTEADNAYLRARGFDSVFYAEEGGQTVNTWYVFEEPGQTRAQAPTPPAPAPVVRRPTPPGRVEKLSIPEAWADMAPEGAVGWGDLSPDGKREWANAMALNRASGALAEEIIAKYQATPPIDEDIDDTFDEEGERTSISAAELTYDDVKGDPTSPAFAEVVRNIAEMAFFDKDINNVRNGLRPQAQAFFGRTFSAEEQASINRVVLGLIQNYQKIEARYTRGSEKDTPTPIFTFAQTNALLPSLRVTWTNLDKEAIPGMLERGEIRFSNLSPYDQKLFKKYSEDAKVATVQPTATQTEQRPEAILAEYLDRLIAGTAIVQQETGKVRVGGTEAAPLRDALKALYAQLDEAGRNYILRGNRLSDYFTEAGEPKLNRIAGRVIPGTRVLTKAEAQAQTKALAEAAKAAKEQEAARQTTSIEDTAERLAKVKDSAPEPKGKRALKQPKAEVSDYDVNDTDGYEGDTDLRGLFYRDDGTPIKATVPPGRVRLLVNAFLSKLRIKPTVHIFANVEDLKRRNPQLYRQAAAARAQGDFDTTPAVGYAFGKDVIIFTDYVRTEQQLRFVLAHETLGHFGFRGVMPEAELRKVLNRIYDTYPTVQAAVDAMVELQGMDKIEAIEEFLADNAADLDVSILARFWNGVKNFLNKLGFKFQDDEARYLINLSRRYVRNGDVGTFFSYQQLATDMQTLDEEVRNGRFSTDMNGELANRAYSAGALNRRQGFDAGLTGVSNALKQKVFGSATDLPAKIDAALRHIQSLDWMARRSDGLSQLYRMFESQQNYARKLLSKYQGMMQKTFAAKVFGYGTGISEEDKVVTGELLARAALLKSEQASDRAIADAPKLMKQAADGTYYLDTQAREALEKQGFVTAEEFRKGFEITYSNGAKVRFQYDVDENSDIWKSYIEVRKTINEAAIDMMLSNFEAAKAEGNRVVVGLNDKRRSGNVFTALDLATIRDIARRYAAIRYKNSSVDNAALSLPKAGLAEAEELLVSFGRALFNDDIYKIWAKDPTVNTDTDMFREHSKFQDAEYDDIRSALGSLRKKTKNDKESFAVQKAIRDVFLFDLQSRNAEYYAKRTILGSYVPFTRRGKWQARLVATDTRGNPIELSEKIKGTLPYFQTEEQSEAQGIADELEKRFSGEDWTFLDDDDNEIKVRFKVQVSTVRQTPDMTEAVNYNEFVYALNRLNVNLTPEVRERIVTTLTAQNARARKNLMRSGNEGWDKDVIRSASEHLETTAHVAAKKLYSHRIDDILLRDENWLGDEQKLKELEALVDAAPNEAARARAQRAYDEYAFQFKYMAPIEKGVTVKIAGKEVKTLGRGRQYQEEAKQLVRFYNDTSNLTHSTEDMLSGETGSQLKLWTVLAQLGGTVASAAVNFVSTITHTLPYLSGYNSKTAFGGGYGTTKSAVALAKAAADMKNPLFGDAIEIKKVLDNGTYAKYGLTKEEAQFLFDQSEEGTLQAAQFNALLGTARGKVFDNRAQAAIRIWMSMFTYTEQFNRRVAALATYRMELDRARAAGLPEDEAREAATEAARRAVNTTQGEYALFNRAKAARGTVSQYLFMYKMFSIITIQLLRGMAPKERMIMLGILLLVSGLKGLPFAEDLRDLIDTIITRVFGLKVASVEKELALWLDSVAPGVAPYALRGVLDTLTGATISSRLGMGDLLPLTGALRYGASPIQELTDFAGPMVGFMEGAVGMAGNLAKYGAEAIGLRDDTTSFSTIMRESPVAAFRAVADGLTFLSDGRITNIKGQVVSQDAPALTTAARLLGFYPAAATVQNDIVRLSKYTAEYAKAVKAEYVSAYVKAALSKDTAAMNEQIRYVKEWNEDAKGTGLEINSFVQSAKRALKEAERPTVQRYLRAAPKDVRPETEQLLEALGYTLE